MEFVSREGLVSKVGKIVKEVKTDGLALGLLRKLYKPGRAVVANALVNQLYDVVSRSDKEQPSYARLRAEFDDVLAQEIKITSDLERKLTFEVMGIVSRPRKDIVDYTINSDNTNIMLSVVHHLKQGEPMFNSNMVMDLYEHLGMEEEARTYAHEAIAKLEKNANTGTNSSTRIDLYKRIGDYENAFEVAVRAGDFDKAEELIPQVSGTEEKLYRVMIEASLDSGIYHKGFPFRIQTLEKIGADGEVTAEKKGYLEWQLNEGKTPNISLAFEVGTRDQLKITYDRTIVFHLGNAEELPNWVNTDAYIEGWQKVQDVASQAFTELRLNKYSETANNARDHVIEARDLLQKRGF